jgi:hypothetical protein
MTEKVSQHQSSYEGEEMSTSAMPKENASTGAQANATQSAVTRAASVPAAACDEEIRRRAYEIYLQRGEQPGHELDDWFHAERELERGVLARAKAAG